MDDYLSDFFLYFSKNQRIQSQIQKTFLLLVFDITIMKTMFEPYLLELFRENLHDNKNVK